MGMTKSGEYTGPAPKEGDRETTPPHHDWDALSLYHCCSNPQYSCYGQPVRSTEGRIGEWAKCRSSFTLLQFLGPSFASLAFPMNG